MLNLFKNNKGEILNLFFKDTDKEYYLREIARNLDKKPSFFQKALNSLVKEGILKDKRKGNLRFFKLNEKYPLYEEFKKIISKTLGIEAKFKEHLNKMKGVDYAFIYGSFATNKEYSESDIDVIFVGNIDQDILIKEIHELEGELNREINYLTYYSNEIVENLQKENSFLSRVFRAPKIILKGNINELTRIRK